MAGSARCRDVVAVGMGIAALADRNAGAQVLENAADGRGGTGRLTGISCGLPLAGRSMLAWSRAYGEASTKSRRRGNDCQKRVSATWEKKGFAR